MAQLLELFPEHPSWNKEVWSLHWVHWLETNKQNYSFELNEAMILMKNAVLKYHCFLLDIYKKECTKGIE